METMTHKVTMTVELMVEAPNANVKEEVEGVVYWKATSDIESAIGETLDRGVVIKGFNIEMNN